jgi:hypothetical protein
MKLSALLCINHTSTNKRNPKVSSWQDPPLIKELEDNVVKAEALLASAAKKLGLNLVGRPDISYGFSRREDDGTMKMYYQARAE